MSLFRHFSRAGAFTLAIGVLSLTGLAQAEPAASSSPAPVKRLTMEQLKSATLRLAGNAQEITLANGEFVASDSSFKVALGALAEPALADIDGDGQTDAVVLLTVTPKEGKAYSEVGVLRNENGGAKALSSLHLGSGVEAQKIAFNTKQSVLSVTALQEGPKDEPGKPTSKTTFRFKYADGKFTELPKTVTAAKPPKKAKE